VFVLLTKPRQLGPPLADEVIGVLPQCVGGAFEVPGVHVHPTLAGGVLGVASDLVQHVTGSDDDVERIGRSGPHWAVRRNLISDPLRRVSRDVRAWEQIGRVGKCAFHDPRVAVTTGAGPVGLLAALLGVQRGLEVHVFDRIAEGVPVVQGRSGSVAAAGAGAVPPPGTGWGRR
jgi:hypothetical protein